MKKPFISVIVPTFNQEKYIGRCLRSLLDQSLIRSMYEIIVINDGSTDTSNDLLAKCPFITLLHLENNSGKGVALRKGIEKVIKDTAVYLRPETAQAMFVQFLNCQQTGL